MPSIEIACIGLSTPLRPPPTSFAVVCEPGLTSHRSPTPRFQADFDGLSGCLYHLGNPQFAGSDRGAYFAYDLLSPRSVESDPPSFLEFDPVHVASARSFLQWVLAASPARRILFTSDWQFGPDWTRSLGPISLTEFWNLHDSRNLLLNAAYPIANAV
jgi:hypothetical protein